MNYRSIAQLSDQLVAWSRQLPPDLDLVVGLPRSGLLAANILALYRNLPVADLDGFLAGRTLGAGTTRANPINGGHVVAGGSRRLPRAATVPVGATAGASAAPAVDGGLMIASAPASPDAAIGSPSTERFLDRSRKVLVLDDSIWSGDTLRDAKRRIDGAGLRHEVSYGAVYVTPETVTVPDHYCEVLRSPRCFEWNVLHHHVLRRACVALEGVLCAEPLDHEDDDGECYRRYLHTARPLHVPTSFVGHIVSGRPERFRAETERWLAAHGVEYGELAMSDHPDGEAHPGTGAITALKAKVYRRSAATLFLENDLEQAVGIANLARREVLCLDTMQMIVPGSSPFARPGVALADDAAPGVSKRIARRMLSGPTRARVHELRRRVVGGG